jgi:hypothetical protein
VPVADDAFAVDEEDGPPRAAQHAPDAVEGGHLAAFVGEERKAERIRFRHPLVFLERVRGDCPEDRARLDEALALVFVGLQLPGAHGREISRIEG